MYFEKYKQNGQWRWRLKAANHEIVASSEGYVSEAGCDNGIDCLKRTTSTTPVKTVAD